MMWLAVVAYLVLWAGLVVVAVVGHKVVGDILEEIQELHQELDGTDGHVSGLARGINRVSGDVSSLDRNTSKKLHDYRASFQTLAERVHVLEASDRAVPGAIMNDLAARADEAHRLAAEIKDVRQILEIHGRRINELADDVRDLERGK